MQTLPGVRSVSFAEHAPFDTAMSMKGDISAEGAPVKDNTQFEFTPCQAVDEHYLETTGMTVAELKAALAKKDLAGYAGAAIGRALALKMITVKG